MRYSKKGREKIGEFMYNFQRCVVSAYAKAITPLKFEPSDFEDCVVLTTEEARELIDLLSHAEDQRQQPYSYDACDEWAQLLTNRIEQSTYEG